MWDAIKQCDILRDFLKDINLKHPNSYIFRVDWQKKLKTFNMKEMII